MIGTKTFRSEEERLLSLLDEQQGPYPLLTQEDPVIFHNKQYERELFMEYNLDFGGESSASPVPQLNEEEPMFMRDETKLEPSWLMSPSESEDPATSPPAYYPPSKPTKIQPKRAPHPTFNPYSSGPLIKEPSTSRSRGNSMHMVYRCESPASKRGRPSKTTSTSKMANYARNYREQKKSEMSTMQMRNAELEAENRLLREENARMKKTLTNASDEITQLKKVIDQDSQIARVVANMGSQSTNPYAFATRAGVCVHVGSHGTTVEVCKQCADNNQLRMDSKFNDKLVSDFSSANTELFGGDFSVFDNYLSGNC